MSRRPLREQMRYAVHQGHNEEAVKFLSRAVNKQPVLQLTQSLASMPENSRLLRVVIFVDLLQLDFRSAAEHFSTLQDSTADTEAVHETGCVY
jgi:hypothetical protein